MSCNNYKPHLLILPEDDANRQIAIGFCLSPGLNSRVVQILPIAGGWSNVVTRFKGEQVIEMQRYPERRIVLMVDFDDQLERRLSRIQDEIPKELSDRVFVLGTLSEPENLRTQMNKSYEKIGQALSQDCVDNTRIAWNHQLLRHNATELDRLIQKVRPFLFN